MAFGWLDAWAMLGGMWKRAAYILTSIGGIIMFAAGVGPTDAASNLAQWYEWITNLSAPHWLAVKKADSVAISAAIASFVLAAFSAMHARSLAKKKRLLGPNDETESNASPFLNLDWDVRKLVDYLKKNLPACKGMSTDNYDQERIDTAFKEIRDQACLGNIQLYGSAKYNGPPVKIPRNYWEEGQLQASLLTTRAGKQAQSTEYYISGRSWGPQISYIDIHVSSAEAKKLWPRG